MVEEMTDFVNWIRRRNPSAYTWKSYTYDLKQFHQHIGAKSPAEVTVRDIDDFIDALRTRGLQSVTINRRITTLISFFRYLTDEQPALTSPVLPHRHLLRTPRKLPRSIQEADVARLFKQIEDPRDRAMFLLMLRSGLRVSEVAKLTLRSLYLHEQPPRIIVFGKFAKERSVYLSDQTAEALQSYLTLRPKADTDALFLTYLKRGIGVRGIQKRFKRYCDTVSLKVTPHQLRHNFANNLVLANVPMTSIQKLMGHAWVTTTQRYLSANHPKVKADFFEAIQRMEGKWHV